MQDTIDLADVPDTVLLSRAATYLDRVNAHPALAAAVRRALARLQADPLPRVAGQHQPGSGH